MKALRFLGFGNVRVLHQVTPKLPDSSSSNDWVHQKGLSDRSISTAKSSQNLSSVQSKSTLVFRKTEPANIWNDLNQRYIGFKSNSENLNCLCNDLVESEVARRSDESAEDYRQRVELTLVACGLADMDNGVLRGLHTINKPLSQNQLFQLEASLDKPFHDVVSTLNASQSKAKLRLDREIDRYPKRLVEVCSRMPVDTKENLLFVSRHCHHYLTKGEGQKVLEKNGFPAAVDQQMELVLPRLPSEGLHEGVMIKAEQFRKSCEHADATRRGGQTINGIEYAREKSEQVFNPDSPEHRCLIMTQGIAMGWEAYCESRAETLNQIGVHNGVVADQKRYDEAEKHGLRLLQIKSQLNDLWLAMSHNIILSSKGFSTNFDSKNYQQVVLRGDDKTVYWSSDNVQPRGGWFDRRRFEPVTLPK